jgi:hypothetical protein
VRIFDYELKIPTVEMPGIDIGGTHFDELINKVCFKFDPILPGLKPSQLRSGLKEGENGYYSYFGKVMDILQSKIAKIEGERWIRVSPSTYPLWFVDEKEVLENLRQSCSLLPTLIFGIPTAGLGIATAITLMHKFQGNAQTKWCLAAFLAACTVAAAVRTGRNIFQHAKYKEYLKLFEDLPAQKPANLI